MTETAVTDVGPVEVRVPREIPSLPTGQALAPLQEADTARTIERTKAWLGGCHRIHRLHSHRLHPGWLPSSRQVRQPLFGLR
jgi:hypothetical protein